MTRDDQSIPEPSLETDGDSDAPRPQAVSARRDVPDENGDRRSANQRVHRRLASHLANAWVLRVSALSRSRTAPPGRSTCTVPADPTLGPSAARIFTARGTHAHLDA